MCCGHLFFTVRERESSRSFQPCRESPTSPKWSLGFLNVLWEDGRDNGWGRLSFFKYSYAGKIKSVSH